MTVQLDAATLKALERKHLRYISDAIPGIRRKGVGKGFFYLDPNGIRIINPNTIGRVETMNIPPAWKDVWINPYSHGHLQATGTDSKGRKQYIYHPVWNEICQENKFSKLPTFGQFLPKIRRKVSSDIRLPKLVREKVLATIVWLLEHTFIRVGNEEYAKENNSFGLTTLRNKHVKISKNGVRFEFIGKSGVAHEVSILHPLVKKTIKMCVELPGYHLFQYQDGRNRKHAVDSGDVNEYLQNICGEDITAKDFRTWGGTVLSASTLNSFGVWIKKDDLKRNINKAVKVVSSHLRNTPKVCKNYYIHPVVIHSYEKQILIPHFEQVAKKTSNKNSRLSFDEFAVLELLRKHT